MDPDERLRVAIRASDRAAVRRAIAEGADTRYPGMYSSVLNAAQRGDCDIIRELLAAGADIDQIGDCKRSALHDVTDDLCLKGPIHAYS